MGEEEEEEVQDAEEDAGGRRKRKRGAGVSRGEVVEEGDAGVEAEVDGGGAGDAVYDCKDLLGEDEDGAWYEGIAEEAVAEVMRWLEAEISPASGGGGPGFVTINGNEESCGPSFSAAASTVMASVDTGAGAPPPPPVPWPWPERPHPLPAAVAGADDDDMDVNAAAETRQKDGVEQMGSAAGGDADEEWLARLLTCGGPLLEGIL